MAPGYGDVSMARRLQTPWSTGNLKKVLAELQASRSIHFHKTHARWSLKLKFGQCDQLTLPLWFIEEHADEFEEWAILRTLSSFKPWRVRLSVSRTRSGSPQVKFMGGWKRFATENRLKEGDSLVFVLNVDARSEFQVYIFQGTGRSLSNSQTPGSKRSSRARISVEIEKGAKFSGGHNLRSACDGNMRKTGDMLIGKKKKVEEMQQNQQEDSCTDLESDHGQTPSAGFGVEQKSGVASEGFTGIECKGFAPRHGTNLLPSFRRRIIPFDHKAGRLEVPASSVRTHGLGLQTDVKVQGIHQESPVSNCDTLLEKAAPQPDKALFPGWVEKFFEGEWPPGRSRASVHAHF